MKIIGLTGSIATGKSSIGDMFNRLKIPVHDSDKTVHSLIGPKGAAVDDVIRLFGDIKDSDNGIDRKKLSEIVFSDPKAKADLETVIHPLVRFDRNIFIGRMMSQRRKIAVVDIPLLYETGSETICDVVICSWAPYFLQKQRALKRFGMSEEKFNAILKQQIPQREKMILADFCLPTGLGKAYSYRLLKGWLSNQNKKHLTRKF